VDLQVTASRWPDKAAIISSEGTTLTYCELWTRSLLVARFLRESAAIQRGDRVAISTDDGFAFATAMYGAWLAGACVVPINPAWTPMEMGQQLIGTQPAAVVGDRGIIRCSTRLQQLDLLASPRAMLPTGDLHDLPQATSSRLTEADTVSDGELALLTYTSGTAGLPKASMHTHRNLNAAMAQLLATGIFASTDVILNQRPFFHTLRLVVALGATCVQQFWIDPTDTIALIDRYRPTVLLTRPFALGGLVDVCERLPVPRNSLRLIETSGSPLDPSLAARAGGQLGCRVAQAYHLLECAGATNRTPPDDHDPRSIGWPVAGTEERLVEPDTEVDVPLGTPGELLIRGPQICQRYWQDDAATTAMTTRDGWFRTGDLVRQGPDGRLYFVDRLKELIKVRGLSVHPAEIESLLRETPGVRDVAVAGIPDPEYGQVPWAFVVADEATPVTAEELIEFLEEHLSPHKLVDHIEFVDALPRGPGGKLLRRELSARAARDISGL
jgi:acyl-CoA synthetase (AMP-forming)/AMP-acid ligase II